MQYSLNFAMKFIRMLNYAMALYRIDPEIYPLMLAGFTTMSWGGILMLRKASQVRYENRVTRAAPDFDNVK